MLECYICKTEKINCKSCSGCRRVICYECAKYDYDDDKWNCEKCNSMEKLITCSYREIDILKCAIIRLTEIMKENNSSDYYLDQELNMVLKMVNSIK